LNKMTTANFDRLYETLLQQVKADDDNIRILMEEVFRKATKEHGFIEMYADLCARLHAALGEGQSEETNFKRLLLNQCQESFMDSRKPLDTTRLDGLSEDERLEAYLKHKEIVLGNAKLIGELLRRRMIVPKILGMITDDLLGDATDDSVEILCVLLRVVCPHLSMIFAGRPAPALKERLAPLANEGSGLGTRARCLVRDVLDMWEKANGPAQRTAGTPLSVRTTRAQPEITARHYVRRGQTQFAPSAARPPF
jgi:hypothetical protein